MKGLSVLTAACLFLSFAVVLAAEKPFVRPSPRTPELSTAGKVLEVSETLLTIERTLKGTVETMDLVLESPIPGVAVGDQVRVNYRQRDGQNLLLRVSPAGKTAVQKPRAVSGGKPAASPLGKPRP